MLENATVAISPKALTAVRARPAVEYSKAASIACSIEPAFISRQQMQYIAVLPDSHQPAGEGVGLEGFCMPHEEHLILRSIGAHVAEQLKQCISSMLRQDPLGDGV